MDDLTTEIEKLKRGIRCMSTMMDQATADSTDELSNLIKAQFQAMVKELLE